MPLRLQAAGRGRNYSRARGLVEAGLRRLMAGDWPGRAWGALPGRVRVRVHRHRLAVLPAGLPPLRLGFLSDLHLGPTTPSALLDAAFAHVAAARPDVVLLGGDYVFLDATPARADELERRVAALAAPVKLAVLGNHDLWAEHHRLEAALAAAGATVLVNDARRLPGAHGAVAVLGLDDPWTGEPDAARAVAACGDAAVRIGLVHAPDGLPLLPSGAVAALLCGHTHGGQVALPGGRPLVVPGAAGKRWPHGRHEVDGTTLLVSRGLGGVEVPFRAWAPPDVLVVDLVARRDGTNPRSSGHPSEQGPRQ